MNLATFLANKCFAFLLAGGFERKENHARTPGTAPCPVASPRTILPPWTGSPQDFRSKCDGCARCIASCEEKILVSDRTGFPHIDFSYGACTFCGACAASCAREAFTVDPAKAPWQVRAVITSACLILDNVLCRICTEHCAAGAILIPRQTGTASIPQVLADRCNGCGACFSPCPSRAIVLESTDPQP